jgi:hypothetical protein
MCALAGTRLIVWSDLILTPIPWSAAASRSASLDRMGLIWLGEERVQGDLRGPGGPPYQFCVISKPEKTKCGMGPSDPCKP